VVGDPCFVWDSQAAVVRLRLHPPRSTGECDLAASHAPNPSRRLSCVRPVVAGLARVVGQLS